MAGTISHIRDSLSTQLDRLSDGTLEGEELRAEIGRARAMSDLSGQILEAGKLALQAARFMDEALTDNPKLPEYFRE